MKILVLFKIGLDLGNTANVFKVVNRMGRGGGLVVSVLAFYSDDPSLNPAGS